MFLAYEAAEKKLDHNETNARRSHICNSITIFINVINNAFSIFRFYGLFYVITNTNMKMSIIFN